jgi:hypothetical protein
MSPSFGFLQSEPFDDDLGEMIPGSRWVRQGRKDADITVLISRL